jgi:hypothetical protein
LPQHALQLRDLGAGCSEFTGRHRRFTNVHCGKRAFAFELTPVERLAGPAPCLRATSDTLMSGSYVSRTKAAFSSADQRLRRSWLTVTTSIVCLFLVICTVLFLPVRITHRPCPVNQGGYLMIALPWPYQPIVLRYCLRLLVDVGFVL